MIHNFFKIKWYFEFLIKKGEIEKDEQFTFYPLII
jgi:hypothetical protein